MKWYVSEWARRVSLVVEALTFSVSVQPFGAEDAILGCIAEFVLWVGVVDVTGIAGCARKGGGRADEGSERKRRQSKG